jgi:small GTP-binding protein
MSGEASECGGEFQLLTSPGPAAIAVVRLRGAACRAFVRRHVHVRTGADPDSWTVGAVLRAELRDESGEPIDDILVSVHAPPPTCDVRLHLHGSPAVVRCCREMLSAAGLTEKAEGLTPLWPSRNLIEAEVYTLLPRMLTLRGVEWLTKQVRLLTDALQTLAAEPDVEVAREACREIVSRCGVFEWFSRPLRTALIGPPNAGKSTLANALVDRPACLVSPVPGTTRDWVEIPGELEGFPVLWLDTAGLGEATGALEAEAIRRTRQLLDAADAVLLVLDAGPAAEESRRAFLAEHPNLRPACIAVNKMDLLEGAADSQAALPQAWRDLVVPVSAIRRMNLDALGARLLRGAGYDIASLTAPAAFSVRQVAAMEHALRAGRKRFRECLLDCVGPATAG